MTECIYCRTTCNDGEMPCPDRNAAESCAWFTESDRRALQHSGEPQEQNTTFPMTSASEEGGHINPSPSGEVEKVIERLSNLAVGQYREDGSYIPLQELCNEAASLLTTAQAEIERLRAERDEYKQRFESNFDRRHAAENEARLKGEAIVQMQYRLDAMEKQMEAAEAGHRMQTKATLAFREDWLASQAQAEEMRKALEPLLVQDGRRVLIAQEVVGDTAKDGIKPVLVDVTELVRTALSLLNGSKSQ